MRITSLSLIAGAAFALSGCAYNGLGVGVGYGNDPYGYGYGSYGSPYGYGSYGSPYGYGARYGYGSRYGYGYGSPYYGGYDPFGRYGNGYGYAPFGWYNDYYYPGSGHYVYDRNKQRREMTPAEKSYWRERVAEILAKRIRERSTTTTNSSLMTTQAVPSGSVATEPRPVRNRDSVRTRNEQRSSLLRGLRAAAEERRSARREAAPTSETSE